MMSLLRLFWSFFQVGLFTFGGGYASLPLVQEQAVGGGWMSMSEFTDLLTISQMTPGPVSINLATFVGLRYDGIAGAVVATFAFVLPSFIIVSVLAILYRKYSELSAVQNVLSGLRPATVGLILSAGLSIVILSLFGESGITASINQIDFVAAGLFVCGFAVLRKFKLPPLVVILACGAASGLLYTLI
jgi:chromate transporter